MHPSLFYCLWREIVGQGMEGDYMGRLGDFGRGGKVVESARRINPRATRCKARLRGLGDEIREVLLHEPANECAGRCVQIVLRGS